ncbi:MAG: hypothetical protein H6704_22470 [Myxococcales bacterium]|nr:hypothetical protein [Myxococcales bacterium]
MVTAALAGGAWTGLQNGLVSVGIDVAATAAAKKIPYVAGFIEVGRLAYDPKAWLDTTAKGLVGGGKIGSGIDKIASGNPIDIIEGVLDIGTGINQIVGTISSILWIVAAAGFIVSLFFPALLPFVALAAKWAALLGTVSATLGLALQALRPIVIGLRAVDILYLESDPAAAEAKAAGLQETTAAFAADWTARSGKAVRGRAAARRDAKAQAAAQGKPLAPPTRMPKPPLWSRIAGVMTGELGKGRGEAIGGGFAGSPGKPGRLMPSRMKKDIWDDARNTAGATRDTFRARGTGERLAGLEARGVQTYTSQQHKDRVNRQLEQRGGKGARDTSVQAAEAQQRQAEAEQRYRDATQRRNQTRAELRDAERRVREANQKVQAAQRGSGAQRAAAEAELNERKALLRSYQSDVRQLNSQLGDARTTLEMARSAHQANPNGVGADGVPFSQKVAQAQQRVSQLESQMTSARSGVREADALVADGRSAVDRARAPIVQARQEAQAAVAARNQANTANSQASQDRQGAVAERRDARGAAAPLDTETNRQAQAQFDARMQHIAATGGGDKKDYLHSQNPPDSSLGLMAKNVDKLVQQETAQAGDKKKAGEALFDAVGGAFGGGDAQAQQPGAGGPGAGPGAAGPGGAPVDHVALIQAKLAEITASLPSPPLDAPGRIDGAALAMEEVLAEEARLTEAKADLQALSVEGEAQVTEMQGAKGMVEANQGGADALQAEADALLEKQTELKGKADETSGQAAEGKASGSKGHGMLAPILSKMLQLFGMLPEKIAKGGGAGGKTKQLGEAAEGTTNAADAASEAAQAAGQEASARTQTTSQVKGGVDADKGALDGLGQQIEADQQSAEQGIAEVQQGEQTAEQELQTLAAEKTRLEQEHASQVQAATAWATEHQGTREGQMAELEALVAAAEAAKQ